MHETARHGQDDPEAWAPADACTLPTVQQPVREAEFDALFATALRGIERRAPTWLRLELDAGAAARTRELTAREASCCSFFDFRLARIADHVVLDVRVPAARTEVLDALARRAAAGPAAGAIA